MLVAAFVYASVGHGGASAYLAAMALAGVAPAAPRAGDDDRRRPRPAVGPDRRGWRNIPFSLAADPGLGWNKADFGGRRAVYPRQFDRWSCGGVRYPLDYFAGPHLDSG